MPAFSYSTLPGLMYPRYFSPPIASEVPHIKGLRAFQAYVNNFCYFELFECPKEFKMNTLFAAFGYAQAAVSAT